MSRKKTEIEDLDKRIVEILTQDAEITNAPG